MPDTAEFILLLIASYLVGAIPMAFLMVKWRYKADIRKYGSGGVGASNVFRSFSKPLGIAIGIFDALKGVLMVWIGHLLGLDLAMEFAIGAAVIIGHNWPVWLRFNAGRGLSTTIGVASYLFFPWGVVIFATGAVFTLLIGTSPLPVLVGIGALPVASWLMDEPLTMTLGLAGLFAILVIRRLTAPLSPRSRTVSKKELYLNRLLFDRDIRDGKAWITLKPVTSLKSKKEGKE